MENKIYDNSGSLWTNEYKKTEKQPDLKGDITINGRKIKLSAWKKTTKDGKNFISLKIDTFEDNYQKSKEQPSSSDISDFLNNF
jgi:uncharacterized protein (DUF736 family)